MEIVKNIEDVPQALINIKGLLALDIKRINTMKYSNITYHIEKVEEILKEIYEGSDQ